MMAAGGITFMRLHTKTAKFILTAFIFSASFACFAQDQNASQPKPDASTESNQSVKADPIKNNSYCVVQGGNAGSSTGTQCVPAGTKVVIINESTRRDQEDA